MFPPPPNAMDGPKINTNGSLVFVFFYLLILLMWPEHFWWVVFLLLLLLSSPLSITARRGGGFIRRSIIPATPPRFDLFLFHKPDSSDKVNREGVGVLYEQPVYISTIYPKNERSGRKLLR